MASKTSWRRPPRAGLGTVVAWLGLIGAWLLVGIPGSTAEPVVGAIAAVACLLLAKPAAAALGLRGGGGHLPWARMVLAVPRDVLRGIVVVLRGRWPGRRRVLQIPPGRVTTSADRALAGVLVGLGPATYLVCDEPFTIHQLGRGAGPVADRLLR
ncbi:MAG TPA: hypothetical protein VHC41_07215 [Mycobacteriales bacterium]|jgi:hypothetical protein|nr:hypothetical protein [Mycobacteriales bacterium]